MLYPVSRYKQTVRPQRGLGVHTSYTNVVRPVTGACKPDPEAEASAVGTAAVLLHETNAVKLLVGSGTRLRPTTPEPCTSYPKLLTLCVSKTSQRCYFATA